MSRFVGGDQGFSSDILNLKCLTDIQVQMSSKQWCPKDWHLRQVPYGDIIIGCQWHTDIESHKPGSYHYSSECRSL